MVILLDFRRISAKFKALSIARIQLASTQSGVYMNRFREYFFAIVLLCTAVSSTEVFGQATVWKKVLDGYGESVGINPINPNTIYGQASDQKLAVSRNQGKTWTELPAFVPPYIRQIIVHPNDTLVIFITDFSNGLWRSTNAGGSWSIVIPSFGIDGESVTYDPNHPDTMYAGNFGDGSLYRSSNRGANWTLMGAIGTNLCALAVRPDSSNILLAGSGSGRISKSTNSGATWHLVKTAGSTEIPKIVIDHSSPQIAYATAFEGAQITIGVWKTTNGGEAWFKTGLQNINVWSLDIDQTNPAVLYAGSFDQHDAGVYKTTDAGVSWTFNNKNFTVDNAVWNLHIDPINTSNVYAAVTNGSFGLNGIFKLMDSLIGVEGYVRDSMTNAVITSGSVNIQPANETIDLSLTGGKYYFYRSTGDTSTSQTFSVTINSYLIKQQTIAIIEDSLQERDILVPPGSVRGTVYNDFNANGSRDFGEPGLPSWTILLSGPGSGSTITDSAGDYVLNDLLPGVYTITEQPKNGWYQTEPVGPGYNVTVSIVQKDYVGKVFGDRQRHAVIAVTPAAYSTTAPASTTIEATFDTAMNASTFNDTASMIVSGKFSGRHTGTITFNGSNTVATFTPDVPFQGGEIVSVGFASTLLAMDGISLTPHSYQFSVAAHAAPGSFVGRTNAQVGSAPWGVAAGDLDGDGDNDLVSANSNSSSVSVLKNDGLGSFGSKTDYSTGAGPISVALADVDLDGDLDIVTANNGNSNISVLVNNGNGTFPPRTDYSITFGPFSVQVADMNGDGYPDVEVAAPSSAFFSVLINDQSGGFPTHQDKPVSNSPWSSSLGDLDNDGTVDVMTVGGASPSSALTFGNLGTGTLSTPVSYTIGANARAGCIAEVTGDGLPDLLATNSGSANFSILPGNGSTFGPKSDISTGTLPWGIGAGDLTGDGLIDVVVANVTAKTISLLRNTGGGTFSRTDYATGASPREVVVADLDGDGDLDVAATDSGTDSVSIYINTWSVTLNHAAGWNLMSLPLNPRNHSKALMFPSTASNAFIYSGNYVVADSLRFGAGFWLKFSGAGSNLLLGDAVQLDTIDGRGGWNMVGALSAKVSTTSAMALPPAAFTSNFYSFDGSYHVADTLVPGSGYWVKLSEAGKIVLTSSANQPLTAASAPATVRDRACTLTLRDASGSSQQLFFTSDCTPDQLQKFEMPPRAPDNGFDARFASGRILEGAKSGANASFPIDLTNAVYPLALSWKISDETRDWALRTDGAVRTLHGEGAFVLSRPAIIALEAGAGSSETNLPHEFALEQNFPNPFNPATVIRYSIPVGQDNILSYTVSLRVYNMLGQEVATLVNREETAGYKSVEFDASGLPSGVYTYRLSAGSFNQTKKMLLVK